MPCNDITDLLRIRLGHETNRVERYSLTKVTCGGRVGKQNRIQPWLDSLEADQILKTSPQQFLDLHPCEDEIEEYLLLKQFFSVRAGVAVLLGQEEGRPGDFCSVEAINYTDKGIVLRAHLRIDTITDEIKACGRCCSTSGKQ